jgi:hypothetical protein
MLTTLTVLLSLSPPDSLAPPYEFDPVTAEVSEVEHGGLEVLAFDAEGRMDGAMLAMPLDGYIQIDGSFGDGYVSFEMVVNEDGASIRNVEMDLDENVAEHRLSTMLGFASVLDGPEQPTTKRGCMLRFGAIATLCAAAIAVPPIAGGAAVACTGALLHTYCECLPLLGYDPCN